MIGAAIIVVVLVAVIPVSVLMSGGLGAGIIGHFLKSEADANHADSEMLGLN